MNNLRLLEVTFIILLFTVSSTVKAQFTYVSPLPKSEYHHPQTTIILRNGDLLDESSIHNDKLVEIYGSKSGYHSWKPVLSEKRTLIIKPDAAFAWGETVNVTVNSSLKKRDGSTIEGTSFSFMIRNEMTPEQRKFYEESKNDDPIEDSEYYSEPAVREDCHLDSMPPFQVTINSNASPGQIFYNNQDDDKSDMNSFPAIIENDGAIVWACDLGLSGHDFKLNYNGYVSYFSYADNGWIILDSNLHHIDTIQCGNGYQNETNGHDIVMYPDGHVFVIAYNPQILDMSLVVPGGKENATVKGFIVQELDANEEVIFQWRSWDHFQITDATLTVPLTGFIVDYVHGNAVERDNDGNIMISSRNMSEITKIDIETGDMIWRMGGENNQFTFVNDNIPEHFAFQHDIRRIANGNVTLFNNGIDLPLQVSSAKEYHLDEVNKVATLIWYYEHPKIQGKNVLGTGSGSVQRLPNGSTIISWGKTVNFYVGIPNFTEIDANENITWEFTFDSSSQRGYRVHKYVWNPCQVPISDQIKVKNIMPNAALLHWNAVNNAIAYDVQYRKFGNTSWKFKTTTKTNLKLKNLAAEKIYEYQVRSHCLNEYTSDWTPVDTFQTPPLRLSDAKEILVFNLYPNPTSGELTFNLVSESDQSTFISIYDLAGNVVVSSKFDMSEGEWTLTLDVSNLSNGFYLAEVKSGTHKFIQKFVKQ